jgi:Immunoglobulin V-set domain
LYAAEIVPINVKIVEGNTLELNCSLKAYSKPEFNSSQMYFEVIYLQPPERKAVDQQYLRTHGPRMLQLLYPNVSVNDTGTYECRMNETNVSVRLQGVDVKVGSK